MSIGMVMATGSPRAAGDPGHYGLKINVQENTQTSPLSQPFAVIRRGNSASSLAACRADIDQLWPQTKQRREGKRAVGCSLK